MAKSNSIASIQFFRGVDELIVPEIRLTRSRDGRTGQAFFIFEQPDALNSESIGDIKGMILVDEEGELVLTTLTRTAMPLIRYRTGDLVHPQIYGEKLILKGGILGRTDDMTIVRGVNVYPSIFERILRDFDEVAEYQVIVSNQGNLTELLLKLEPIPNTNEESLREMVGKQIRNQLNLRVNVEITAPDTLPRFELKAKRWIQE